MNISILLASPRKNGNTMSLLKPFIKTLKDNQVNISTFFLHDMKLNPCIACRNCQKDWSIFGCIHNDDMQKIFDNILNTDLILLATPIYSWYCTPPMKAILDRLVYGMNKYYGKEKGPSLWKGKSLALITTSGYPIDKGPDLFEEGIIRYSKHSNLNYLGSLKEHDLGYDSVFMDSNKELRAINFAKKILEKLKTGLI